MSRILSLAFVAVMSSGSLALACPCKGEDGAAKAAEVAPKPGETVATLFVDGMHCGGCSGHVKEALGKVKGVGDVTADFKTGKVTVAFNPKATTLDAIKAALKDAGYPPRTTV